jgi:hypothetical protein
VGSQLGAVVLGSMLYWEDAITVGSSVRVVVGTREGFPVVGKEDGVKVCSTVGKYD